MHVNEGTRFVPTLDSSTYSDPEQFKTEMERIFYRDWIYAAHDSQLPDCGSYVTLQIGDKPILLIRGTDRVVRAFYNICVHRGHILAKGTGRVSQLTCPYHAWTYGCDGILRRARGVDNISALPAANSRLLPIEVDSAHGFLFVRLQSGGPALTELFDGAFGDLKRRLPQIDRLRFVRRFVADVDGNWKIMIENYLECYHCAPTHPALVDLIRIREFKIALFPYYLSTHAPAGRTDNSAYRFSQDESSQAEFSGWWLWPNLTFNIFPGIQNLLIFHMLPISAEKTVGVCDYFFLDGQLSEQAEALMDWESNVLEKEDDDLVVSAHRGMKSKALAAGIFIIDPAHGDITEEPLAHFNQLVSKALNVSSPL